MSRIGRNPVIIPDSVELTIQEQTVSVKGPLGTYSMNVRSEIDLVRDGNVLTVTRKSDDRHSRSLHGLTRTLVSNLVVGVSTGFETRMELVGVGYRAAVDGNKLNLSLGYSHPVSLDIPDGSTVTVEGNTKLLIKSNNKQVLGDFCAEIRGYRPPEPYKGKGIRFAGEKVRRKAGKSGKK
jgi:large subunit ribosomal protein L6